MNNYSHSLPDNLRFDLVLVNFRYHVTKTATLIFEHASFIILNLYVIYDGTSIAMAAETKCDVYSNYSIP